MKMPSYEGPCTSEVQALAYIGHATINMIQCRYGKWIRTDGQDVTQMIEKLLDL